MQQDITTAIERDLTVISVSAKGSVWLDASGLTALRAALGETAESAGIRAVVLALDSRASVSLSDHDETILKQDSSAISKACAAIDDLPLPIVACLSGPIEGDLLALALACDLRVAADSARIAVPDLRFGQIPRGGVTQRLPALLGAGPALDLILSGRSLSTRQARLLGLTEKRGEGTPLAQAKTAARGIADGGVKPARKSIGLQHRPDYLAAVKQRKSSRQVQVDAAAAAAVDCVEAALLLPKDAAIEMSSAAFEDLMQSDRAASLRHLSRASGRVAAELRAFGNAPTQVETVGLFGANMLGSDIAAAFLQAGFTVTLVDPRVDLVEMTAERVVSRLDSAVKAGRLSDGNRKTLLERLSGRTNLSGLADVDLAIDVMPETDAAKRAALGDLDGAMKPGALLFSHAVDLDIGGLAAGTSRPGDILAVNFAQPMSARRLVDLRIGRLTDPETVATARHLFRRMGRVPILWPGSRTCPGERMHRAYMRAAEFLLEDGAHIAQIDSAMRAFGFARGPFELADILGLDQERGWREALRKTLHPDARFVGIVERLCQAGRFGRGAGRGFYTYSKPGMPGTIDTDVTSLVAEERLFHGVTPRSFTDAGIRRVCLLSMVSEGLQILADGVAKRPSDLDLAMVEGHGFPRRLGGPFHQADRIGLIPLRSDLAHLHEENPHFWVDPAVLDDLIRDGGKLGDWNRVPDAAPDAAS